jgi:hypothetical protein
MTKISNVHLVSFKLNQFTIGLKGVKQTFIRSFFCNSTTLDCSLPGRTLSSLSIAIWLEQPFCQKLSKHHKPPSLILHLSNIWKSFQPPFPCCNNSFSFCIFKQITMAICGWNTFMPCWAHILHHLPFQGQKSTCFELKDPIQHCIINLLHHWYFFRILHFAKLSHD